MVVVAAAGKTGAGRLARFAFRTGVCGGGGFALGRVEQVCWILFVSAFVFLLRPVVFSVDGMVPTYLLHLGCVFGLDGWFILSHSATLVIYPDNVSGSRVLLLYISSAWMFVQLAPTPPPFTLVPATWLSPAPLLAACLNRSARKISRWGWPRGTWSRSRNSCSKSDGCRLFVLSSVLFLASPLGRFRFVFANYNSFCLLDSSKKKKKILEGGGGKGERLPPSSAFTLSRRVLHSIDVGRRSGRNPPRPRLPPGPLGVSRI